MLHSQIHHFLSTRKLFELSPLRTRGRLLIDSLGTPHFSRGVSGFDLCNRFENGHDILPFLDKFARSNEIRIFWYTPMGWGDKAWSLPHIAALIEFHKYVGSLGYYVENCCITDDDIFLAHEVKYLIYYLAQAKLPNALLEAVNEPYIHEKLPPEIVKKDLVDSGYLYTSAINDADYEFYGNYCIDHTPRDSQWPRKCKHAEDDWNNRRVPCKLNEPIRPDQATSFNDEFGTLVDYYSYGAGSVLFGAGVTFHFEGGKFGDLPNNFDEKCYHMMMDGVDIFPVGASALGTYTHRIDLEGPTDSNGPIKCLRVFQKGNYGLVFRDKGLTLPSNWKPLDNYKVAYLIK